MQISDHIGFSGLWPKHQRCRGHIWTASQPFLPEPFQQAGIQSLPAFPLLVSSLHIAVGPGGSGQTNLVSCTNTTQCKLVHDITRRLQLQAHLGINMCVNWVNLKYEQNWNLTWGETWGGSYWHHPSSKLDNKPGYQKTIIGWTGSYRFNFHCGLGIRYEYLSGPWNQYMIVYGHHGRNCLIESVADSPAHEPLQCCAIPQKITSYILMFPSTWEKSNKRHASWEWTRQSLC